MHYIETSISDTSKIKQYEFIYRLGEGAQGEVWLVARKSDEKWFALKITAKILESDLKIPGRMEEKYALAQKEADIIRSLDHPNIIKYVDSFQDNVKKNWCILMEYAAGGTLSEQI